MNGEMNKYMLDRIQAAVVLEVEAVNLKATSSLAFGVSLVTYTHTPYIHTILMTFSLYGLQGPVISRYCSR